MSVFTLFEEERSAEIAAEAKARAEAKETSGVMCLEFYNQARGDRRLLMIYKKYEIAAKIGDYSLMTNLYGEFKLAANSMN